MACCLPTCAKGSSVPLMGNVSNGFFWVFLVSSWCLVHMESPGFSGLPVMYKTWVAWVCLLPDMPFW